MLSRPAARSKTHSSSRPAARAESVHRAARADGRGALWRHARRSRRAGAGARRSGGGASARVLVIPAGGTGRERHCSIGFDYWRRTMAAESVRATAPAPAKAIWRVRAQNAGAERDLVILHSHTRRHGHCSTWLGYPRRTIPPYAVVRARYRIERVTLGYFDVISTKRAFRGRNSSNGRAWRPLFDANILLGSNSAQEAVAAARTRVAPGLRSRGPGPLTGAPTLTAAISTHVGRTTANVGSVRREYVSSVEPAPTTRLIGWLLRR